MTGTGPAATACPLKAPADDGIAGALHVPPFDYALFANP